ncbi:hypothetical protein HL033_00200 [Neoehrlichia mikurensis]|uniref:3-hydroxyacyl-CoA dehydrogenase NAD-binding domain-containing protein n=1 Tax=Neoehrlichia mikurensis TaxID=89586 RepID=A0A9Q9BXV2_9RICK|nr:3-hydroxyacyl-CoA dehydrogenase NAD-binding domain-containing protein [Neoehrlichia mikurensis]QXK92001.1 hypothetical protein IAH97_00200 [Neoehrlichia mikurensis]QXK92458.1 hypothetical protein HUN61_00200 [Neoehrlichia mikurensis]QXK93694.1 hypothetical protein HL033_00200 [Neoehrlichia mikurensis]UTO55333.1 3-hydroxyacyl-CoA dehydrogenase NAD-binding domain-containing protein [Neoehrlichia mikurensis]UTO56254.1 3-hydroxyacyl-CoA dehydrogenase NAD-binding domain-containing protein [Neoeh
MQIERVAILGINLHSTHIAECIANIGIPVVMYCINSQDMLCLNVVNDVNSLIQISNLESGIDSLKFADLIIDSMANNLDDKCQLYHQIINYINVNAIISLNSSIISLNALCDRLPSKVSHKLIIAHFSYIFKNSDLLECVIHSGNTNDMLTVFHEFCEIKLNKKVIICADIAGLLINRIGYFWIINFLINSYNFKIDIDIVDSLINEHICNSRLGIFRLLDSIGLDIFISELNKLIVNIAKDDLLFLAYNQIPKVIFQMIADKVTGCHSILGGFYRKYDTYHGSVNQMLDLSTGLYKSENSHIYDLDNIDKYKSFIYSTLSSVSAYITYIAEITGSDILTIDNIVKSSHELKYELSKIINKFNI